MIEIILFVSGFALGSITRRIKKPKGQYENNLLEVLDEVEESTNTSINISEQEKPFIIEDKKEDMYSPKKQHEIEVVE